MIEKLPISAALQATLKRAVAQNPQDRFQNAHAFCDAFRKKTAGRWRVSERSKQLTSRARGAVVLVVIVVVATGGWLLLPALQRQMGPTPVLSPTPQPAPPSPSSTSPLPVADAAAPSATVTVVAPGPQPISPQPTSVVTQTVPCREGTRPVAAARVWIGIARGRGGRNDDPRHQVDIGALCMDAREVTVADYKGCMEQRACDEPDIEQMGLCNWNEKSTYMTHPMNCVTWLEAQKYCKAQEKRLPTEEEWEYAARGTDERLYPWGSDTPYSRQGLLNACDKRCEALLERQQDTQTPLTTAASDGYERTAPANEFAAGQSPFGLLQMAGNVAEWTESRFCPYPKQEDCRSNHRVYRGGSWYTGDAGFVTTTTRDGLPEGKQGRRNYIGFRCAYTPVPALR